MAEASLHKGCCPPVAGRAGGGRGHRAVIDTVDRGRRRTDGTWAQRGLVLRALGGPPQRLLAVAGRGMAGAGIPVEPEGPPRAVTFQMCWAHLILALRL